MSLASLESEGYGLYLYRYMKKEEGKERKVLSISIGKIIGVEIKLHYTWFIVFMLIMWTLATGYMPHQFPGLSSVLYWLVGAISAFILFASVLFHELAHSYIAKKQRLPVPSITLFLFGGVSQIAEEPEDPGLEFKMAIVGPLSSFALSALFAVAWFMATQLRLGAVIVAPLSYASMINLFLGGFNLLPAFPLDGGRMLRAGIWRQKKDLLVATKLSTRVSTAIAYGMMGIGFIGILLDVWIGGLWLIFIAWFLKSGSEASLKQTIVSQAMSDVNVEHVMNPQVVTIPPESPLAEIVEEYFYRYKHGGFPVVQDDRLVGIITIHDVRKIPKEKQAEVKTEDVMTPVDRLVFVKPDEPAVEALIKLSKHNVGRLPVLKGEKLVGIVTRSDVLKAIRARTEL